MKMTICEINDKLVAGFEGELDTAAADIAENDLSPLMQCTDHDIVLDCSRLTYISSSGLRLFLSINKKSKASDHHVYIKGLSDDLLKVFRMTGFDQLFILL